MLNGTSHPNFSEFANATRFTSVTNTKTAKSVLEGVKHDLENDYYLQSLSGLVTAEIFSDYLEMAEYLLDENWYIPAAVIIGSTLEEHLRKLCSKNGLPISKKDSKGNELKKMGSELNTDLYSAKLYNKVDWSLIQAFLKIRNNAAHGNYNEFNIDQVRTMRQGGARIIRSSCIIALYSQ